MASAILCVFLWTSLAIAAGAADNTLQTDDCQAQGEEGRALLQSKRSSVKAHFYEVQDPAGTGATGASAPLTEEGYMNIASQCCNWEMQEYIRRVVFDEGMQVCNEYGLMGITPYYSCQAGPQTLAKLKVELHYNVDTECPWVAYASSSCRTDLKQGEGGCPDVEPGLPELDCGCVRGNIVNIDFFQSTVTHSNLAGVGPDGGAQEIRYTNIGTFNSQVLDLVVTASSTYLKSASNPNATNGKRGKFGTINLLGGASTELTFTVVQTGTNTPQELHEVHFSLFDLDTSYLKKMKERIYVNPGFHAFVVAKDVEFDIQRATDGKTAFMATHHGIGCDNPSDPEALGPVTCTYRDGTHTIDQKKRSFMMIYRKASSWKFTISVTCNNDITGDDAECQSGRNILFAGESSLKDRCED